MSWAKSYLTVRTAIMQAHTVASRPAAAPCEGASRTHPAEG